MAQRAGARRIYLKKVVKENAEKLVQKMKDRVRHNPLRPSTQNRFQNNTSCPEYILHLLSSTT
jgi:hypothetical protein